MDDWDSPKRSRFFLAAALLTAACGLLLTNDANRSPVLVENSETGGAARPAVTVAMAAAAGGAPDSPADARSAAAAGSSGSASAGSEQLRDAVAAAPFGAAQQAARSAAFAGPGGRVPGAFAPAAAGSAFAARRALGPDAGGDASSVASSTAAALEPAQARAAASSVWDGSSERTASRPLAAGAREPRAAASPAQRLFEAPERGLGRISARGAATAGTAAFPSAASPRQRQAGASPRVKPASLAKLLGKGALKAPTGLRPPAGDPWSRALPAKGPGGEPLSLQPAGESAAEAVTPPPACAKRGAHWDLQDGVAWLHDSAAHGRLEGRSWSWLEQKQGRWWLWPAPKRPPLVLHEGHWWLKSRGLWFLLHDSEPWGWQYLREWDSQGFVHSSGAQMIYSADGARLGLIVPGEGAILYDSQTGRELGRWSDAELPRRSLKTSAQN